MFRLRNCTVLTLSYGINDKSFDLNKLFSNNKQFGGISNGHEMSSVIKMRKSSNPVSISWQKKTRFSEQNILFFHCIECSLYYLIKNLNTMKINNRLVSCNENNK